MTLWAKEIQQMTNLWYFSYFSQKAGFDISCKLSLLKAFDYNAIIASPFSHSDSFSLSPQSQNQK